MSNEREILELEGEYDEIKRNIGETARKLRDRSLNAEQQKMFEETLVALRLIAVECKKKIDWFKSI